MGQVQGYGEGAFQNVSVKEQFVCIQNVWSEDDFDDLITRLKDTTLNFSLDSATFTKLTRLGTAYEEWVVGWFAEFTRDRASEIADGLEFLAAAILVSSRVALYSKICLMFKLFDLDRTGSIRKDEFTIFLRSVTTGLRRMLTGLPPPAPVQEFAAMSTDYFNSLPANENLSQRNFYIWATEAHHSLSYLSVLSRLGSAVFATGVNDRLQLGLHHAPSFQRVPAPVLNLEGISVASLAAHESHCLLLTREGRVWSWGSGFCGILGHSDILNCPQPRPIECLAHVQIVDVSVGVRHSVAVSARGQVFTWGAADLGQLGHGSLQDRDIFEWASDPKTGGEFAYMSKPSVVTALFGKKICVRKASCCNFSTIALTDQGQLYSWGNNTDGQCGQGQRCPDHQLVYVDPHMYRTAMQVIFTPRLIQTAAESKVLPRFNSVSCGGYHVLAVDEKSRLWTWGQGLWGKLGHGDQRSTYEPKLVEALKYHACQASAAGESHSVCLCSMFKLTVTCGTEAEPIFPYALLALPAGRADRLWKQQTSITPPKTSLQLQGFASGALVQIGLPFSYDSNWVKQQVKQQCAAVPVQNAILLLSRSLCEGEWLKLSTSDFDFAVKMSSTAAPLADSQGVAGTIAFFPAGSFQAEACAQKICVFELQPALMDSSELLKSIFDLAQRCRQAFAAACICILPKHFEVFDVPVPEDLRMALCQLPIGVMGHQHGTDLSKCVAKGPADARLLRVQQDVFFQWLKDVFALQPKGIIVSATSWRPEVELLALPENLFDLEAVDTPIGLVSFDTGEELRKLASSSQEPWITMEFQMSGAVCAWGSASRGQLGLAGIENRDSFEYLQDALTGEEHPYANRPHYVAHLHDSNVTGIACGAAHTLAVTAAGEVWSWGAAEGLGVQTTGSGSAVPLFVEQLEALVKASAVFAGHRQSFVLGDMPFKSVV